MNYHLIVLASIFVGSNALVWGGEDMDYSYGPTRESKFFKFLVKFKDIMKIGNDTLGLPIMDPYVSNEEKLFINETLVMLNVIMENMTLHGMSEYQIHDADFTLMGWKATMNLTWPMVSGNMAYQINGKAVDTFPIFGHGNVQVTVKDLNFATAAKLGIENGIVRVKSMQTGLHMNAIQFNATGIYDNDDLSELISAVITDVTPQITEDYQVEITNVVNKIIMHVINKKFSTMTLQQLMNLIN